MRKIFLIFLLLSVSLTPVLTTAQGLVPCGHGSPTNTDGKPNPNFKKCKITDIGILFLNIFNFIVFWISIPMASLVIVTGGVILLISGGNPSMAGWAKKMIWGAVIGIVLILGSWVIIDTVLKAIGYVPL